MFGDAGALCTSSLTRCHTAPPAPTHHLRVQPLVELRSIIDAVARAGDDRSAVRTAKVALWRTNHVCLLGHVATSADARLRLQRLRLDEAVLEAKVRTVPHSTHVVTIVVAAG